MRVIGLMSGTSYDAIDAAAADLALDGDRLVLTPLGLVSAPYEEELREALSAALPPAPTTMRAVCELDTRIGQAFAALAVRADRELCDGRAELISSHGQTVYHWVADGRAYGTLQLGRPAWIAEATGRPVVSDLRSRDIAAGGQGAPLVSVVDTLWLRGRPGVCVALNLGGIANVTVVPDEPKGRAARAGGADVHAWSAVDWGCGAPEANRAETAGEPLAYDTGPGNALIDAAVRHLTGGRLDYDEDGAMAARGTVHGPLLDRLLAEPYYARPAPKTTGKELFHLPYLQSALAGLGPLPADDVVATVTELTTATVADAVRSAGAGEVIASGGGTRNPTLLAALRRALGDVPLRTSDELGLPSAAKEAYAFAVLGFLTAQGLAGTVPACTGARHPSVLGSLTPGRHGLRLPPPARVAPSRLEISPP